MMTLKLINSRQKAFTLVEVIVVVVLLGIMASAAATFILKPIEIYVDIERRQELVDSSELAFRRISRDIQRALPNSLRITSSGTRTTLEVINTVDGSRYRDETGGAFTNVNDYLEFNPSGDSQFNILGKFKTIDSSLTAVTLPSDHRLVVYNTSNAIYSAASTNSANAIVTPSTTSITVSAASADEQNITLGAAHQFRFQSPSQRLFIIDGVVIYICEESTGELTRFEGDVYTAIQTNADEASELPSSSYNSALMTQNISHCNFTYSAGTGTRAGIVTLEMSLSKSGESINLLHQLHITNAP